MKFDYYYGAEAEQFSFYRIPRQLIKDNRFKGLSSDAKLLYGLMLDRMALSIRNGWLDEENRAYIIYTVDDMMEDLGCARATCTKVIKELDSDNGIGLIEKRRRGLGKSDIIYVKNFASMQEKEADAEPANPDVSTEVQNLNFKKFKIYTSRSSKSEFQEVQNLNPNYNNISYNNKSNNINPINQSTGGECPAADDMIDVMEDTSAYTEIIKANIEYEHHMKYDQYGDRGLYAEIYETICDVVCVRRRTIRINGEDYPYELVKSRFLKLDSSHVEYVMGRMRETATKVTNIKAYLVTALYNAPATMNHYYQQEVQHDMLGGG